MRGDRLIISNPNSPSPVLWERIGDFALRRVILGREICSLHVLGALMSLQAGEKVMSKGQKSNKEAKKLSVLTPKEKKAAKRAKKAKKSDWGLLGG